MSDLLSEDEVGALLDKEDGGGDDKVARIELGRGGQRFRAWKPRFSSIDARIAGELQQRMFGLLHKPAEVDARDLQLLSFGEYVQGLQLPSSINICSLSPQDGYLLITLDANLVYSLVDSFFGGGALQTDISGREFSKTELGVAALVLELVNTGIRAGWSKLQDCSFELLGTETNPSSCKAFPPGELMVLRRFKIEFSGGSGAVDLLLPAAAVDGLLGESVAALPGPPTERFLEQRALGFKTTVTGELGGASITLRELLGLSTGDIIPVSSPEEVAVKVNGVTKFTARVGEKGGRVGLSILSRVQESNS